ncbi:hypothetical protein BN59_00658 [Legionella massiliensis]|uniref:Uncharacterized protein n=1 Tax=Legionella massiliensis TaxID=1034943 RepID=A0A078KX88_9GAMM|nr:hypothetical protein [Legionella massiliensis]CDZ76389.1 hypothetical protein BN59_00658 [Legionella massiliensis]CEE12127.1 hypothetical protein BN1094_00658 [Legionella massiliensis]
MKSIFKLIGIAIYLGCISVAWATDHFCPSGTVNTNQSYSSQQECFGSNNETIHTTCQDFCNSKGNGWYFTAGKGEYCSGTYPSYAYCVCQNDCASSTCPTQWNSCPPNLPVCPQSGRSINVTAWSSHATTSSCEAHCIGTDFSYISGCKSQGCYVASNANFPVQPCVLDEGSYDVKCYCGELETNAP